MCPLLMIAGIIDCKYRRIPNIITVSIFIYAITIADISGYERCAGFLATALPLLTVAIITGKIRGGDYKFLVAVSTALGLTKFVSVLVITTFISMVYSVVTNKRTVPLASVLSVGYLIYRTITLFGGI